jgi:outer membrane receptor protein involved in Fe transport
MIYPARLTGRALILGSSLICASSMLAQDQAAPASDQTAKQTSTNDEDVVYLSPFEVSSEGSIGYQARDTLAGTRLRTDLKDVANAIQVINSKFLQDTGATDTKDLLVYTTNTEVGGIGGNFGNIGTQSSPNDQSSRTRPQNNTRVRGLDSADNTRDFFLSRLPWDAYNVDRVDINRGANSILFGIGSPAGIVNTNLQQATMFNEGKVEARIGSYGSIRGVVNVNHVILDGQLSVRVAGLYDDEQYQQRPAYELDRRAYVALRYDPKWAKIGSSKLTIKMNYENGDIKANRPHVTPPVDQITPWYTELNQATYDPTTLSSTDAKTYINGGSPAGYGALKQQLTIAKTFTGPDGTVYTKGKMANPEYTPWINDFSVYYIMAAVYPDVNSSEQSGIVTGSALAKNANAKLVVPYYTYYSGVTTTSNWASKSGALGSTIGGWKDNVITDTNIFDYRNKLLEGDTKKELENWDAYNVTVNHTFFDDAIGYSLAYDYQKDKVTYKNPLASYSICVDTSTLLSDGVTANPNVGRAYVVSRGYGYSDENMYQTYRLTAYAELDLKKYFDPDSFWVKLLGRHVFQGNYSHFIINDTTLGWNSYVAGEGYGYGSASSDSDTRAVAVMSYISGDLRKTTSASQIHASSINSSRNPSSGSTTFYTSKTASETDDVQIWNDSDDSYDNMRHLYRASACSMTKKTTDSWGLVWNGYLMNFDENDGIYQYLPKVVPTIGYRQDKQTAGMCKTAFKDSNGDVNFYDSGWKVPTSSSDDIVDSNHLWNDTGWQGSTAWGIVLHMPDSIVKKLPLGINVSLFFNKSNNFSPDASRIDLNGEPVASPKGDTKDYGFVISALDEKITLKVNWYKSTEENATLDSNAIGMWYEIAQFEGTAFNNILQAHYHLGNYATDQRVVDEDTGEYNPAETEFLPWQAGVDSTYGTDNYDTYDKALARYKACYAAMMDESNWLSEGFQKANFGGVTFKELIAEYAAAPTEVQSISITDHYATITGDTQSEGVEFELTTQLTPNWNLTLNASKTNAIRMHFAKSYIDITENRYNLYKTSAYGYAKLWGPWADGETLGAGRWFTEYYSNYLLQRTLEGSDVPELCKWHINLVTNYSFSEGILKNVNIGGGWRWQDKVTIGYPLLYDGAGNLVYDDQGNLKYDIDNPFKGPTEQYFDLWLGYEHQINDKVKWRIQLNVKNVLGKDDLIPVNASCDGTIASYRIPDGRTWYLTNTISF